MCANVSTTKCAIKNPYRDERFAQADHIKWPLCVCVCARTSEARKCFQSFVQKQKNRHVNDHRRTKSLVKWFCSTWFISQIKFNWYPTGETPLNFRHSWISFVIKCPCTFENCTIAHASTESERERTNDTHIVRSWINVNWSVLIEIENVPFWCEGANWTSISTRNGKLFRNTKRYFDARHFSRRFRQQTSSDHTK